MTVTPTAEQLFAAARQARRDGDRIGARLLQREAYAAKAAEGKPVTTAELEVPWMLPPGVMPAQFQGRNAAANLTTETPSQRAKRLGHSTADFRS